MNIVLLRVGIDTGCGGIHSPLLGDGAFEFIPIPDERQLDERTYGNTKGRHGRAFTEYFPREKRSLAALQPMHVDPEFESFTYGDPTPPKRGLSKLNRGDLLVFYAGMEGWGFISNPALYLVGFFMVKFAGFAHQLSESQIIECSGNFHVRHRNLFCEQQKQLVLVKGDSESRLFQKASKLGERVKREDGSYWQLISPEMKEVFGSFGGIGSIQRSTPRWVEPDRIKSARKFLDSLG